MTPTAPAVGVLVADLVGIVFAGWLLAGVPLAGTRRARRLVSAIARRPQLRLVCYRTSLRRRVLAVAFAAVALGLGRAAAPAPGLGGLPRPLLVGLGLAAIVALALPPTAPAPARPLLPVTPVERRLFAVVAVAAAGADELAYRALLPGVLLLVLPGLDPVAVVLVATGAFAAAHAYQGAAAVARAALVGLALAAFYAGTGSLLASVVAHALVDLRLVSLTRPASPTLPSAASRPLTREATRGRGPGADRVPPAVAVEAPVVRRA